MQRCRFTPRTARRALAHVRPLTVRVRNLYLRLEQLCPARVSSEQPVAHDYFCILERMHELISELGRRGVLVRDPRLGLVDFPARRQGRDVLLCWRVGESGVRYWHEVDDGFGERRPVDEEGPWEEVEGGRRPSGPPLPRTPG